MGSGIGALNNFFLQDARVPISYMYSICILYMSYIHIYEKVDSKKCLAPSHKKLHFNANRTQIWVNVKRNILFILKIKTDISYDQNGLIEARFTLPLKNCPPPIYEAISLKILDIKQWNPVIPEKWETNKVNPTISLANSLETVSRLYQSKKASRQSPRSPWFEAMKLEVWRRGQL